MKYFVILLVLFVASILSVNHAYGIWIPQSPEELLEESQVIVVGNITTVNELELEQPFSSEFPSLILDEYTITVEEFVKNPQDTDTLTVRQPTVSTPGRLVPHGGFETGDRVLLYIESFDGTNTYSKESFLIPKQCDTSSVIRAPRIIGSDYIMIQNGIEKKDNFTANTPIQFIAKSDMGTLSGDSPSIEYDAYISKQVGKIYKERVFHQTVTADAKPCEWLSVAEWEFTPDAGNYLLNGFVHKEKSGYSVSNTFFSVLPESPLKQIQSGISLDEIQCKQNLVLVQKYDGTPACVTEQTKTKLIERGWTGSITESEYSILRDILDRCEEIQRTGTFDGFAYGSSWQNETHYIDNNSCRWIYLEKYLDENNELNFALKYDNNGMIIDDLQRIYDYCDYSGKKPDWYFSWNNQTHHIDSSQCKWYGCDDGEIYYRGVCMAPEAKEKALSVGEKENEN